MPAHGGAWNAQTIVDTLFGCCLGARRDRHAHGGGDEPSSRRSTLDEQTPLLAGQKGKQSRGDAANGGIRGSEHSKNASGSTESTVNDANGQGQTGRDDSGPKSKKKKAVDARRLQVIRDQAHAAFFNVESSQLLPSTSSLAQRQASMGTSQRLNRRDQSRDRCDDDDDDDRETSYTSQQRKQAVAASDQAERLYKAAIQTSHRKQKDAIRASSTLSPSRSSTSSEDEHEDAAGEASQHKSVHTSATTPPSGEPVAPIGLVRQVRLSVRDSYRPYYGQQLQSQRRSSSTPTPSINVKNVSPSRPKFTLQSESFSSASTSHESNRGGAIPNSTSATSKSSFAREANKYPSVHSLRTLRLGLAPPTSSSSSSCDLLTEDDLLLLGRSAQSFTSEAPTSTDLDRQTPRSTDDERWEQRGRTRSRRGLVWMDTTMTTNPTTNANASAQADARIEGEAGGYAGESDHARLSVRDIWKSKAADDTADDTAATTVIGDTEKADEIQYGLRFDVQQATKERRQDIMSRLSKASNGSLANSWDEPLSVGTESA